MAQHKHADLTRGVSPRRAWPRLEGLEDRLLLNTYPVTNVNDSGPGSLRQAILDSNASPGFNTITFAIGSGVQILQPLTVLPTITNPVLIDGSTQPGFAGNAADGLDLSGGTNLVQGNILADNSGTGLSVTSANNTLGGTAAGAGNIVVLNALDGVRLSGSGASGNRVQGNFLGTGPSGASALGNGGNGMAVVNASGNTIGGTTAGAGNVIAFNGTDGVLVDTGNGNAIQQNSIFSSGNLGIELRNGGNNGQAAPVLTAVTSDGSSTSIAGTLTSTPWSSTPTPCATRLALARARPSSAPAPSPPTTAARRPSRSRWTAAWQPGITCRRRPPTPPAIPPPSRPVGSCPRRRSPRRRPCGPPGSARPFPRPAQLRP